MHFGHYQGQPETCSAWSSNSRVLACGNENAKIHIWDTKTGQLNKLLTKKKFGDVYGLSFHPTDPNRLAAGYGNSNICIWDIEKSEVKECFTGHLALVACVAWEPQGRFLASGSTDDTARVWNLETGKFERTLREPGGSVGHVEFTRDGKFLCGSTFASEILLWSCPTFQLVSKIRPCEDFYDRITVRLFKDDKTLISVNASDRLIKFYDVLSGKENTEMSFESKKDFYWEMAVHPNQNLFCLAGKKGFEIWDLETRTLLEQKNVPAHSLSFSPNGRAVAVAFKSTGMQLIDLRKYFILKKTL